MSRADTDLAKSVKKACSPDEAAPKRKHVRSCIVYTWDHKSSRQFFQNLQALVPVINGHPTGGSSSNAAMDFNSLNFDDDIKVFKMLITLHKVLQEGHKSAIIEGIKNIQWLQQLGGTFANVSSSSSSSSSSAKGYGRLIAEYVHFLCMKLKFHKYHKGFNGTFEYEEYVSLITVDDPNQGYETILDLMDLQDSLFDMTKIVFASIQSSKKEFSKGNSNECKISCLVPLVTESYGIYKFITSMLRAMFKQTGDEDALVPLKERFEMQHHLLFEFYADCSSIKILTSLITIPRLPTSSPNVFEIQYDAEEPQLKFKNEDSSIDQAPELPQREEVYLPPASPPAAAFQQSQPTADDLYVQQQLQYEQEQLRLEQERQQQLALQQQQQQQFEQQQRALQEQQQLALQEQQRALQDQQQQQQFQMLQQQQTGAISTLQSDLITLKNQYEQDQMLLQQYDQRVQQLENEITNINNNAFQQVSNKEQQLESLNNEMVNWKTKYDSLAKLYSQLRQEHLQLLNNFKKLQQKAASAQESIEKREKMERDLKLKNIELADLIRERDRARLDNDKLKGSKEIDIDQLSLQVRELNRKLKSQEELNSTNLQKIFQQHQQELVNLKNLSASSDTSNTELAVLRATLEEKDQELEIMQQTMEETIRELEVEHQNMQSTIKDLDAKQKISDDAIDEQIDQVLQDQLHKLTDIVDSILTSGMKTIQDSLFELTNPLDSGNSNTTPQYVLSLIEKVSDEATNFASNFNDFLTDGPNGDYSSIISTVLQFSSSLSELLVNCKGLSSNHNGNSHLGLESDFLSKVARVAREGEYFLEDLLSENLSLVSESDPAKCLMDKQDIVINGNVDMQEELHQLSEIIEPLSLSSKRADLATSVETEMHNAEKTVIDASKHLPNLLATADFSGDLAVNKAILEYAMEIIQAILKLIKSSIECQSEIVAKGMDNSGLQNKQEFYKKNSRWTEGLISASRAVADSTKLLISMGDGILKIENSYEEFIVASNDVVASTAQLVAASRVKAGMNLKSQHGLEDCSKIVNSCVKKLVKHIQSLIAGSTKGDEKELVDFQKLSIHDHKTVEMEQQVEILKLEAQLDKARKRLGEIRKVNYKDEQEEGVVQS